MDKATMASIGTGYGQFRSGDDIDMINLTFRMRAEEHAIRKAQNEGTLSPEAADILDERVHNGAHRVVLAAERDAFEQELLRTSS